MGLLEDEIRAKVISIDLNSSLVNFEISAMGRSLNESTSKSSNDNFWAEANPGDLNLLSNTKVFRGVLKKNLQPTKWRNLFPPESLA